MSAQVAVICVTHDSNSLLPDLAVSLRGGLSLPDDRIVVVDSGSTDATVASVRTLLPEADVCQLHGNRGFAAGINAGVAHVVETGGAAAYVIMNPDVRVEPRTISLLVDALGRRGVGLAVPRLHDEHGNVFPSLRHAPSVAAAWCEGLLGGPLAARLHLRTEVVWDTRRYDRDGEAAWATGCLMAIAAECIARVGPWDESFFLYEEEVDFALRAADAGFRLVYVSDAVATRVLGPGPVAPWAQALMHANRVALVRRRTPGLRAALIRAAILVADALRTVAGRREAAAALWAVWHRATPAAVMGRYNADAHPVVASTPNTAPG